MKVFALYRLKKYNEPVELNQSRPHFDFVDGTDLKEFDEDEKEINKMRIQRVEAEKKAAVINNNMQSLINKVEGDKVSDLHTVKEESDLDRNEEEFDYPKGMDRNNLLKEKG